MLTILYYQEHDLMQQVYFVQQADAPLQPLFSYDMCIDDIISVFYELTQQQVGVQEMATLQGDKEYFFAYQEQTEKTEPDNMFQSIATTKLAHLIYYIALQIRENYNHFFEIEVAHTLCIFSQYDAVNKRKRLHTLYDDTNVLDALPETLKYISDTLCNRCITPPVIWNDIQKT
tara:strand:+ start:2443 stop:2964 length:522 start_codon:yes stop_codon:yes gene_type:complete